jgi:hypothetical protein
MNCPPRKSLASVISGRYSLRESGAGRSLAAASDSSSRLRLFGTIRVRHGIVAVGRSLGQTVWFKLLLEPSLPLFAVSEVLLGHISRLTESESAAAAAAAVTASHVHRVRDSICHSACAPSAYIPRKGASNRDWQINPHAMAELWSNRPVPVRPTDSEAAATAAIRVTVRVGLVIMVQVKFPQGT